MKLCYSKNLKNAESSLSQPLFTKIYHNFMLKLYVKPHHISHYIHSPFFCFFVFSKFSINLFQSHLISSSQESWFNHQKTSKFRSHLKSLRKCLLFILLNTIFILFFHCATLNRQPDLLFILHSTCWLIRSYVICVRWPHLLSSTLNCFHSTYRLRRTIQFFLSRKRLTEVIKFYRRWAIMFGNK